MIPVLRALRMPLATQPVLQDTCLPLTSAIWIDQDDLMMVVLGASQLLYHQPTYSGRRIAQG